MTVRALKGSIYTTTGVCLAAGLGLGITSARVWAQSAPDASAPAVLTSSTPVPQTAPVEPAPAAVSPAQVMSVQAAPVVQRSTQETVKARYLVQVMEGVLERAVKYAATQMNRRLQAVSPDLLQLSGAARARGFRLDGYGVFFDVEVPAALRQTMGWTFRSTMPNDHELERALTSLRTANSGLQGKQRADADTALKLIELKVRPVGAPYTPAGERRANAGAAVSAASLTGDAAPAEATPSSGSSSQGPAAQQQDVALTENPDITYEMEVRDALVGAMLAYGTTLSLQADEWLTIAARDNQNVIVPGDLTETVTVILRIKGSDLAEYRAGRVDEATVRRRVEVREF